MRLKLPVALLIAWLSTAASFSAESSKKTGLDSLGRRTASTIANNSLSPQIESRPRQSRKRALKKRRKKAPLVDSALLRFISSQKKQQQQLRNENLGVPPSDLAMFVDNLKPNDVACDNGTDSTTMSTLLSSSTTLTDDTDRVQQPQQQEPPEETSQDRTFLGDGQFNHNRVAQKLVSIGADEAAAQAAGERVQNVLLVRTARRRIREFLRERDSLWDASTSTTESQGTTLSSTDNGGIVPPTPSARPEYGFDDVVDLLLEFGLTGTDICAILSHSPSVALMKPRRTELNVERDDAKNSPTIPDNVYGTESTEKPIPSASASGGETLEETLNRSFKGLLCSTLKLRRYDARKVLRTCPGLLSKRGSKSAMQIVSMLSQIGVSANSIARNKSALPMLLSRSPSGLFRLVSFLSSDAIRMPVKQIGPLIRRSDSLELLNAVVPVPKRQPAENSVSSGTDELTLDVEVNRTEETEMENIVLGRSAELRRKRIADTYKRMASTAWTLRDQIGTKDLGKVVSAYPSVLLLDAREQIMPVAWYLMDELGICEGDLPSVLQLYPILLGKKVSDMRKVESFLSSLDVDPENFPSIFRAFPALLTLDVEEDMKPVVEYLRSIGISNIGRFITRLPPVLGYSIEKELAPKWQYLNSVCMYSSFELSKFPAYFSYPLERVIKTRYEYLSYKRFSTDIIPVDLVLRYGDKDFATKVALDDDGGKRFRAFAEQRKKQIANSKKRRPKENNPLDNGNS